MSALLRKAPEECDALADAWIDQRTVSLGDWDRAASEEFSQSVIRAFRVRMILSPDVERTLERTDRGFILGTIHMGDYLLALFRLLASSPPRSLYVLRRRPPDAREAAILGKIEKYGHEVFVIRHGASGLRRAIESLGCGAVLIAPFDLPSRWGATFGVSLFGRRGAIVGGPARLAVRAQVPLVSCIASDQPQGMAMEVCGPLTSGATESPRTVAEALTQDLADTLTRYVSRHPEQWHHWPLVPLIMADDVAPARALPGLSSQRRF
jgi:lauroyl/myristoyl acyltransferase